MVETSGTLRRIQNCRLWVNKCANDHSRYGRRMGSFIWIHWDIQNWDSQNWDIINSSMTDLQCSLPENYRGFPVRSSSHHHLHLIFISHQSSFNLNFSSIILNHIIIQGDPCGPDESVPCVFPLTEARISKAGMIAQEDEGVR